MLTSPSGEPVPRVVTGELARALGFNRATLRTELHRCRWRVLVRGIYLTRPDPPCRSDWIAAGVALAGPGGALSGWDAVRTYGVGSVRPPTDEVLILSRAGTHRLTGRVRMRPSHRRVGAQRRRLADGLGWAPTAPIARAVADTALVYRWFDPVRALVTEVVQRRLCAPEDLVRELEDGPRNGSAHLRRAVQDVLLGVESISEAELADVLRAAGLPMPEFNVPILTADGRHLATADALWRHLRAGLEVDSRRHHFLEPDWMETMRRHNRLTALGLAITHYPPHDLLHRPAMVTAELALWLRRRAAELGVAYPGVPDVAPGQLHRPFVLPRSAA